MSKFDLAGRRFNQFMVLAEVGKDRHAQRVWLCQCDCGVHFTRTGSNILAVTRGTAAGRGCLECGHKATAVARTIHGDTSRKKERSSLYMRWSKIKGRCENKNHQHWKYYGGKGVRLCQEWYDYRKFKEWALANGFREDLEIDRINSAGNYEPGNCQWITGFANKQRMHAERGHTLRVVSNV